MLLTKAAARDKQLGVTYLPGVGAEFLVWAPNSRSVGIRVVDNKDKCISMEPLEHGYHYALAEDLRPGDRYLYRLDDGRELPDPASRFQPEGVHGPSQIVDTGSFDWTDQTWRMRPLEETVFYELHVGTYTAEGSFEAILPRLPELFDLGITTIELMPVAQFPGSRNWGYDGVYPFAPQNTYGNPNSLRRLINAAHGIGLSVALDVVYNHLGPEGNYLNAFGPYFTGRYRTPWGEAINFDAADSDEVRRFFIENALYWLENFHFDALRLDAIHGIFDFGAYHFLAELKSAVSSLSQRLGRPLYLIAESDLNDSRILHDPREGGYGIDAQWSDDFHHSVHTLLTPERTGYYADFGGMEPLATTLRHGWYYSGQYSNFRKRSHGNSPDGISRPRFVVCSQNHDQVGNRAAGERLSSLVSFESDKLAAGVTLLSPFTPLLFMGEEYGETSPFQYFTSHSDCPLVEAVRKGRREEFAAFGWQNIVPDPQDEVTFERSHLNPSLKSTEPHRTVLSFYQRLLRIRRGSALGAHAAWSIDELGSSTLLMRRDHNSQQLVMLFNFSECRIPINQSELAGDWTTLIHSADAQWGGPETNLPVNFKLASPCELHLAPHSFLVLQRSSFAEETA
jgi:maltooligosyltrehalose trehalohydrolase